MTTLSNIAAHGILDRKTFLKTEIYSRKDMFQVAKPVYVDCHGNTPLHRAVGVYGHLKMYRVSTDVARNVEFLVKHGANINAQKSEQRRTHSSARGSRRTSDEGVFTTRR